MGLDGGDTVMNRHRLNKKGKINGCSYFGFHGAVKLQN